MDSREEDSFISVKCNCIRGRQAHNDFLLAEKRRENSRNYKWREEGSAARWLP